MPCTGSPSARRAAVADRGVRNCEPTSGETGRALPRPATRSTPGTSFSCITRWRSTPLSAHNSRPEKSVMVAQTGTRTFPRRRRQPRIVVATGQVDTTTSAGWRRTSRRSPREPASDSPARANERNTRLPRSAPKTNPKSHGADRNCQRYPSLSTQRSGQRRAGRTSHTVTAAPTFALRMSSDNARAAATCPSPTGAVNTSTRTGGGLASRNGVSTLARDAPRRSRHTRPRTPLTDRTSQPAHAHGQDTTRSGAPPGHRPE